MDLPKAAVRSFCNQVVNMGQDLSDRLSSRSSRTARTSRKTEKLKDLRLATNCLKKLQPYWIACNRRRRSLRVSRKRP